MIEVVFYIVVHSDHTSIWIVTPRERPWMTWKHGVIQVLLCISCNVAEEDRIYQIAM
jgi:hypothetical protein